MILDVVNAYGHTNVQCLHSTTLEVTKSNSLSENGDCILAIKSSKACNDLSFKLKNEIWKEKKIEVLLKSGKLIDSFFGYGNKNLTLQHREDIVFRKSNYICERTALVNCSKASIDINKRLVDSLKDPKTKLNLIFII